MFGIFKSTLLLLHGLDRNFFLHLGIKRSSGYYRRQYTHPRLALVIYNLLKGWVCICRHLYLPLYRWARLLFCQVLAFSEKGRRHHFLIWTFKNIRSISKDYPLVDYHIGNSKCYYDSILDKRNSLDFTKQVDNSYHLVHRATKCQLGLCCHDRRF